MNERTEYKGYYYSIEQDEDAINPRDKEFDEGIITHMICFHKRHNLGDEHRMSVDELLEIVKRKDVISLPLYLYDHSGITMSTRRTYPYNDYWDAGQVGYIYITLDEIRENMARPKPHAKDAPHPYPIAPIKHITKADRERVLKMLESEVQVYDDYLTGNVYGFIAEDEQGEHIDSCWGYYGDEGHDEAEKQAKGIIDYQVEQDAKEKAEKTLQEVGC